MLLGKRLCMLNLKVSMRTQLEDGKGAQVERCHSVRGTTYLRPAQMIKIPYPTADGRLTHFISRSSVGSPTKNEVLVASVPSCYLTSHSSIYAKNFSGDERQRTDTGRSS